MEIVTESTLPPFPHFHFKEVRDLYRFDLTIPSKVYNAILGKDRKLLIEDLEKVLLHGIEQYEAFSGPDIETVHSLFVCHALFLLRDLKAEESLPAVLHFLKQDEELYNFYAGEVIYDSGWEFFYALGINQLKLLVTFYEELIDDMSLRPEILKTLQQAALHHPEKKLEVEAYLRRLLVFVQTKPREEDINIDDAALDVIETIGKSQFTRLLPDVKKALAEGALPLYIKITAEGYEEKYFLHDDEKVTLLDFRTREDIYLDITNEEWDDDNDDEFMYVEDEDDYEFDVEEYMASLNNDPSNAPFKEEEKENNNTTYTIPLHKKTTPDTPQEPAE